jgi:hypothetical protein
MGLPIRPRHHTHIPSPAARRAGHPRPGFAHQQNRRLTAFFTPLHAVRRSNIDWLWPGRIPLGKLTVLSGQPEVGKSFCAADTAARVTAALPRAPTPSAPSPQHFPAPPPTSSSAAPEIQRGREDVNLSAASSATRRDRPRQLSAAKYVFDHREEGAAMYYTSRHIDH